MSELSCGCSPRAIVKGEESRDYLRCFLAQCMYIARAFVLMRRRRILFPGNSAGDSCMYRRMLEHVSMPGEDMNQLQPGQWGSAAKLYIFA